MCVIQAFNTNVSKSKINTYTMLRVTKRLFSLPVFKAQTPTFDTGETNESNLISKLKFKVNKKIDTPLVDDAKFHNFLKENTDLFDGDDFMNPLEDEMTLGYPSLNYEDIKESQKRNFGQKGTFCIIFR